MTNTGQDAIGLLHKNYPVKKLIKYSDVGSTIGTLIDTTFADRLDTLRTVLDSGKFDKLLVDLLNNTAIRNNKLYPTEMLRVYSGGQKGLAEINRDAKDYNSKLYRLVDKQIKRVESLKISQDRVKMSGLLEHNLDVEGATFLTYYIRRAGYEAVDSPMNPSYAPLPDVINEVHGNGNRGESRSNDGMSFFDANLFDDGYYSNDPEYALDWTHEDNGNYTGLKVFVPPRNRTTFPTDDQLQTRLYLRRNRIGTKPPKITGANPCKGKELWKTFAEDYKTKDPRGSKPMFISKSKADKIKAISIETGKQIGFLKFYGSFDGYNEKGWFRHYLGSGSGETALQLLQKNNGKEWIIITDGRTKWIVNIIRRNGYYRIK